MNKFMFVEMKALFLGGVMLRLKALLLHEITAQII